MAGAEVASRRPSWRLDWSAVIAGVFFAVAAHIVLGLIGAALGFAAAPSDSRGVGAGAAIWGILTPFLASLVGAWVACRMIPGGDRATGNLHGVLVWSIGLVAGALFLTGTIAAGAMSAGTAASGNLGAAERLRGGEQTAAGRAGAERGDTSRGAATRERPEDAAAAAAAGSGAAALASIAGLLGALAGAGISRRRGEGRGFRFGAARREEHRADLRAGDREGTHPQGRRVVPPGPGTSAGTGAPPSDPYGHH